MDSCEPERAPVGVHLLVVGQREGREDRLLDRVWNEVRPPGDWPDGPKERGEAFRRYRCRSPDELLEIVRGCLNDGERIATLDLFDHGAAGRLRLLDGDDLTFEPEGESAGVFELGGGRLFDAREGARSLVGQFAEYLAKAAARVPSYHNEGTELFPQLARDLSAFFGLDELADYLTEDARVRLLGCRTAREEAGYRLLIGLSERLGARRAVYGTIHNLTANDFDQGGLRAEIERQVLYSSKQAKIFGFARPVEQRMEDLQLCKDGKPPRAD
jgi:hypothetical protein